MPTVRQRLSEQVRKLVEGDEVLTTFQIIGTPRCSVQKYLNEKKVPQLLASTGATRFTDPINFPWTIAYNPNYQSEAHIYAKFILANHPNAKIGILYQNDDLGKDYVKGLKDGLGTKSFEHDRCRGVLRIVRSDRRLADGDAESFRRRSFL